ncbi:unnamed protein product, partial [Durusdinium trenchii]
WGEAIKAFVGCVERHAEIRELPVRLQGWTEGALVGRAKQSEAEPSWLCRWQSEAVEGMEEEFILR